MTVEKVENNQVSKEEFDKLVQVVVALQDENKVLKAHADETIKEKREMKAKHDAERADMDKQLADKVNRTKEENEQLIKQYKERVELLEADRKQAAEREYRNTLEQKARDIALTVAKTDPIKTGDLAEKIARRIKLDEDGSVKVLDDKGNITISPVDSLVNELGTKYAYLYDGIQSTGGGAHSSVASQGKKFAEMSSDERAALYKESPDKYNQAKAAN